MNLPPKLLTALTQLKDKAPSKCCIDSECEWCLTVEARDFATQGKPFWLQIYAGALNMQYLDDDEPAARLSEEVTDFPPDFECMGWEACNRATFQMPSERAPELPALLDRIFRQYYGLAEGYVVECRLGQVS